MAMRIQVLTNTILEFFLQTISTKGLPKHQWADINLGPCRPHSQVPIDSTSPTNGPRTTAWAVPGSQGLRGIPAYQHAHSSQTSQKRMAHAAHIEGTQRAYSSGDQRKMSFIGHLLRKATYLLPENVNDLHNIYIYRYRYRYRYRYENRELSKMRQQSMCSKWGNKIKPKNKLIKTKKPTNKIMKWKKQSTQ